MKGYIYKIVNLSNGKVYIGQTIQEPKKRGSDHINDAKRQKGNCIKLRRALHKYGVDVFSFEVIAEVSRNTEDEVFEILNDLEVYYIDYYDSIRGGYNITEGGNGHSTRRYLYLEVDDNFDLIDVGKGTEKPLTNKVYERGERQVSEDIELFENIFT